MEETIRTCSLCLQSFDEKDPLWEIRKTRHEEHHTRTSMSRNRLSAK